MFIKCQKMEENNNSWKRKNKIKLKEHCLSRCFPELK